MNKYIYFDESMDRNGNFNLMGGISIPMDIFKKMSEKEITYLNKYSSTSYNNVLRGKRSKYNDDLKETNYLNWLRNSINIMGDVIKTNIILFPNLVEDTKSKGYKYLIYNKLPERLIYGFLKHDLKPMKSHVEVFIDSNDNYVKYNMDEYLENHLNALSIYRGLNYNVRKVNIIRKSKDHVYHSKKMNFLDDTISRIRNLYFHNFAFKKTQQIDAKIFYEEQLNTTKNLVTSFKNIEVLAEDIKISRHSYGISIIDALLGILNTIYVFNAIYNNEEISTKVSMLIKKANFTYEFLKDPKCKETIQKIRLFCLNGSDDLHLTDLSEEMALFVKGWEKFNEKIN